MENEFYQSFDYERIPGMAGGKDHRTPFQIDRDRVIFSYPFRRLQSKTQVFQSGEYDFYRTRLTHSIEVARIGRSICEYLKAQSSSEGGVLSNDFYIDPDLVEAIGLAHDLGHPPFGHIGERKLNEIMQPYGGFEGNAQTLRILTELIYAHPSGPRGMSPSRAFLDGILKYKSLFSEGLKKDENGKNSYPGNHFIYDDQSSYRDFIFDGQPVPNKLDSFDAKNNLKSIECQIMDWADDAAYSLHDILDGLTAGFLSLEKIERWAESSSLSSEQNAALEVLLEAIGAGKIEVRFSRQIGSFIQACKLKPVGHFMSPKTQRYAFDLEVDPTVRQQCELYKKISYELIFLSHHMQQVEFKGGYILEKLFSALKTNYLNANLGALEIIPEEVSAWVKSANEEALRARRLCDYISDLTDRLALRLYKRLFEPEFGSIIDIST